MTYSIDLYWDEHIHDGFITLFKLENRTMQGYAIENLSANKSLLAEYADPTDTLFPTKLIMANQNSYYFAYLNNESKISIVNINSTGSILSDKVFDNLLNITRLYSMSKTSDGGYILSGSIDNQALLLKLNNNFDLEWITNYGIEPRVVITSSTNSNFSNSTFQYTDYTYIYASIGLIFITLLFSVFLISKRSKKSKKAKETKNTETTETIETTEMTEMTEATETTETTETTDPSRSTITYGNSQAHVTNGAPINPLINFWYCPYDNNPLQSVNQNQFIKIYRYGISQSIQNAIGFGLLPPESFIQAEQLARHIFNNSKAIEFIFVTTRCPYCQRFLIAPRL